MILKVEVPRDPRMAPFAELGRMLPLGERDAEARDERHILRRIELREAVRR